MIINRMEKWKRYEKINLQKLKKNEMKYIGLFGVKGKNGVAGIIELSTSTKLSSKKGSSTKESPSDKTVFGEHVAFKLSTEVNYEMDHEFNVMEKLNELNSPFFVRLIGKKNMEISNLFFKEEDGDETSKERKELFCKTYVSLFDKKAKKAKDKSRGLGTEYPISVSAIFMEKISDEDEGENPKSLFDLFDQVKCSSNKIDTDEKNMINSILLLELLSLEIAHRKFAFVHYDPHSDNILSGKCEKCVFLILSSDLCELVPCYGYYPINIDVGMSYIDSDEKYVSCPFQNYQNGRQSITTDPLNDSHIFLFSILDGLSERDPIYKNMYNRIKRIFLVPPRGLKGENKEDRKERAKTNNNDDEVEDDTTGDEEGDTSDEGTEENNEEDNEGIKENENEDNDEDNDEENEKEIKKNVRGSISLSPPSSSSSLVVGAYSKKYGDKKLPHDLMRIVYDKFKREVNWKLLSKKTSYYRDKKDLINLLNGLVEYPYKSESKPLERSFTYITNFFKLIENLFKSIKSRRNILEIFKLCVDSVKSSSVQNKEISYIEFVDELKSIQEHDRMISRLKDREVDEIKFFQPSEKIFNRIKNKLLVISDHLSSIYSYLMKNHDKIIEKLYNKINEKHKVTSAYDIYKYLYTNFTPSFTLLEDTIIYIFDDSGVEQRSCLELSSEEIEEVNKVGCLKKGEVLRKFLIKEG